MASSEKISADALFSVVRAKAMRNKEMPSEYETVEIVGVRRSCRTPEERNGTKKIPSCWLRMRQGNFNPVAYPPGTLI